MENWAKLLTSIAAVAGAIAWPIVFLALVVLFRTELRSALYKLPLMIDRVRKASLPGIAVELAALTEAEARGGVDKSGQITVRQIEAAARIEAKNIDARALLNELDRLCLEYDALRRTLPAGESRTQAMLRVLVKMRSLAPSVVDFVDAYKSSGSAGSRLAAIAIMQMNPRVADLDWLLARFSSDHPFVFYHAALSLQNVANVANDAEARKRLRKVAEQALGLVKKFEGIPDQNTIDVLQNLISSVSQDDNM